ncbi:MFS transporter [Diaminobutyricimonas aerilata]|uniref:MFS transporter n=1 Tax=Diaminobutyricimonas aerilata TaxID=1162967 RepID=A0A2M9CJ76_9MICO|nr:MFS transporter [Diaminobutyricimonas aerilata]PJJ71949.1 MFS transporter [Diaminobutyricimonas aerilata]
MTAPTASAPTGEIPSQEPSEAAENGSSAAAQTAGAPRAAGRMRLGRRWVDADPVLRALSVATFVSALGRGIFHAVTVLYFTFVVGLHIGEVAAVVTVGNLVGIVTSQLGGQLADRFSARRIVIGAAVIEAVGFFAYTTVTTLPLAMLVASVVVGANSAGHSARSAIVARAFTSEARVGARAVLRTVMNLGIAIGSAGAGAALAVGTADAYRLTLVVAGLAYLASVLPLRRLPARVDAARPESKPTVEERRRYRSLSPWRDRRYLALAALSGVFGMQFGLAEVGVPLWIAHHTEAPEVMVAVLLVLNTTVVILFQVPLSRGTHEIRWAGTITAIAGALMVAACLVYAGAAEFAATGAIVMLVLAALAHAFAEVTSQAGIWGLGFELARPERAGAYQGLLSTGYAIGSTGAPLLVTVTALTLGWWGWGILAAVFGVSALGTTAIAWRAAPRRR